MLFPFGPHRLYPSFVASVSLLLISMLVPKAGGAKGPALRLPSCRVLPLVFDILGVEI